jgi:hypothetical protein
MIYSIVFKPSIINTMRLSSHQRMKKIWDSPLLFIMFSFLYPFSYLLEINSHIYTIGQIVFTLIFVLLVSFVTALAGGMCIKYFVKGILLVVHKFCVKKDIISVSSKLYRGLLGGVGTIILLVLLHSATLGLIPELRITSWAVLYLLVSLCISILTYRFGLKFFNFTLCVLISINSILLGLHSLRGESLKIDTQEIQQKVVFKQKPNVYLVIIESCTSLDIRNKIYGIDNAPLTRELIKNNFDIYKSYANYAFTLPSVAAVFLMDHHYEKTARGVDEGSGYRKFLGSGVYNPVLNTFLNNGYRIDYSKFDSGFYHPSAAISSLEIQPLLQPLEVLGGFFLFTNRILRLDIWGSESFQSLLYLPEKITGKLAAIENKKSENDGRPVFSVIYTGAANHIPSSLSDYPQEIQSLRGVGKMPSWKLCHINNYWITTYKKRIAISDAALIDLIHSLTEKDPDAVVIFLGDHGVRLNLDCWLGENNDLNENILENGLQSSEVSRDLFEAFMAIKWPYGTKKSHECISHVNLFRQIFAVLAKDNSILKTQVSNDSFILASINNSHFRKADLYRTVKDGKILDRWELFKIPVVK